MFGLTVAAALVIIVLAGNGISVRGRKPRFTSLYLFDVASGLGWAGFLSLFFGWLAAMGGASTGAQQKTMEKNVQPIRNAA